MIWLYLFPPRCLPTSLTPSPRPRVPNTPPTDSLPPWASYCLFTPMPSPSLPLSYSSILYSFETLSIRPLHSSWFSPLSHTISKCLHGFYFIYLFISPQNKMSHGLGESKNQNKKQKKLKKSKTLKELSCFLDADGEKRNFLLFSFFLKPTKVTD